MSTPAAIASRLIEIVNRSPRRRVLGTQLGTQLRVETEFNPVQHGKLGAFIAQYAPSVKRLEPQGGDWYFGILNDASGEPVSFNDAAGGISETATSVADNAADRRLPANLWKTYASPATKYRLAGNPRTGEVRVIAPSRTMPGGPWIPIPPCSLDNHKIIAREFVKELSDESARSRLNDLLETKGTGVEFYAAADELGLKHEWHSFRQRRITGLFFDTLKHLGIDFSRTALTEHFPATSRSKHLPPHLASRPVNHVLDIREIAKGAVERMTEQELRHLSLPIGYVLDAIANR